MASAKIASRAFQKSQGPKSDKILVNSILLIPQGLGEFCGDYFFTAENPGLPETASLVGLNCNEVSMA